MRNAVLKRHTPNFNPIACQQIDEYGKKHGYKFQHAMNGGEIKTIGYCADGYDENNNIWIEFQEKKHLRMKRKDAIRRKQIMKYLKCKFIEIWYNGEIRIYE